MGKKILFITTLLLASFIKIYSQGITSGSITGNVKDEKGNPFVHGRTASSSPASSTGSAPMISPVLTFGHETLSSSAGDLVALGRTPTPAGATSSRASSP